MKRSISVALVAALLAASVPPTVSIWSSLANAAYSVTVPASHKKNLLRRIGNVLWAVITVQPLVFVGWSLT